MRKYDFTNTFGEYFALNANFNTRDTIAVGRTFSGLAKLIFPNEIIDKEETRELLEYAIECRRRVKEQLRKMTPGEFSDVDLGYIDLDTAEEIIVSLPEKADGTLILDGFESPGYVYGVGRSLSDTIGIYRLENKLISGTGVFSFKNVEGLARAPKSVKDSINAAFNYFTENARKLVNGDSSGFDYTLYFNDLQSRGVCDEISVAEVVGLFSALSNRPTIPSLVVCGRVVMSGSMMPLTMELEDVFTAVANAGAKTILLPNDCRAKYDTLHTDLKNEVKAVFYTDPLDAVKKALAY
jgi:ATP-dependent Lon protease